MDYLAEILNKVGAGGLVTIFAALIGILGSIYVFRLQRFNVAASDLIAAFSPAVARIDAAIAHIGTHDSPDINEFFKENFEAHTSAFIQFRLHLPRWRRKKYDKAWQEYCDLEPNGGGITLFAGHAVAQNGNHLEFIKGKIEGILKFAQPCA